jgi:hypothetical protein
MVTQPTHKRLSSGIQSFAEASPGYEMAPIGIASMHEQAKKLAEYGRNGDIYIVHAAEGETVIPMEVLNANPKIKNLIFGQMREMGLDPQEFIVGNELNSINPDTGLPEFFLGSVYRRVKRTAKKAFKAAKKIAPYAIPIALSVFGGPAFLGTAFGPGTVGAAALGGGLGSLAGGGSLKDAFKAAVISGGTSAALGGAKSMIGGKSFGQGVSDAFTGSGLPSQTTQLQRLKDMELQDLLLQSPEGDLQANMGLDPLPSADPLANMPRGSGLTPNLPTNVSQNFETIGSSNSAFMGPADSGLTIGDVARQNSPFAKDQFRLSSGKVVFGEEAINAKKLAASNAARTNLLSEAQKLNIPTNPNAIGLNNVQKIQAINFQNRALDAGIKAANAVKTGSLTPNLMLQYGPLAAAGGIAAYAGGAFDTPPVEDVSQDDLEGYVEGELSGPNQLYAANPDQYKIPTNPYQFPTYTSSQVRVPSSRLAGGLQISSLGGQPLNQRLGIAAAGGGYVSKQPRNNELPQFAGYVRGPGTTTSDSIPGYLSDKEFVFNAESVAGADPSGRGDYNAGASNLYNLMRNLQMRA